jgi:hypothetical protein
MGCFPSKPTDEERPLLPPLITRNPSHQSTETQPPEQWYDKVPESTQEKHWNEIIKKAGDDFIDVSSIRTIDSLKPFDAGTRLLEKRQQWLDLMQKLDRNDVDVLPFKKQIEDALECVDLVEIQPVLVPSFVISDAEPFIVVIGQ